LPLAPTENPFEKGFPDFLKPSKTLSNNLFLVLGILKPFANFAEGEFAPSNARRLSKKGLSGRRAEPCKP